MIASVSLPKTTELITGPTLKLAKAENDLNFLRTVVEGYFKRILPYIGKDSRKGALHAFVLKLVNTQEPSS